MEPDQESKVILRVLHGEREAYALLVDAYKTQNISHGFTPSLLTSSEII